MRVVLLMNFVAPYRVALLEALRDRVGELNILISTPMEHDRDWRVEWGTLDVRVQRNIIFKARHRHALGFSWLQEVHFPFDTIPLLSCLKPDAIISGELGARSIQAALYKLFHPRVPFAIWATLSEQTERSWGLVRRSVRRFVLSQADGVLVNGESGARYIRRFGVSDARIYRINQPVDVTLFARAGRARPDGANSRLLYVGKLIARKGLREFAEHLSTWARGSPSRIIEMWWLGDGVLRQELESFPFPANIRPRFFGAVQYEHLAELYAQADLLVFPSLADEWGLVVNEAMASGLPVVGSVHSQAVEELVEEGRTGWLFDPLVASSVISALTRALDLPPAELGAMRANARARIMPLTPDAAASRISHALDQLLGSRRARPSQQPQGPAEVR